MPSLFCSALTRIRFNMWIRRYLNRDRTIEGFTFSRAKYRDLQRRFADTPTRLRIAGIAILVTGLWLLIWYFLFWSLFEGYLDFIVPRIQTNDYISLFLMSLIPRLIAGAVICASMWPLIGPLTTRRRREVMREMSRPICVRCGHNLTGLENDPQATSCPECGAVIAEMPPPGLPPVQSN